MDADVDVAAAAALIGDSTRATFLLALTEAEALPASELARRSGVSAPTASAHLAKLVDGGLVAAERQGRHRYFRLASPTVAHALEALSVIAPTRPVRSLRDADVGAAIRLARTCYDHLAGRLGVELAEALERDAVLQREDGSYRLLPQGQSMLEALGIDVHSMRRGRRAFARTCLDWSERRWHVSGALGAALTSRFFELGWLRRQGSSRAVALTPVGEESLREHFGLVFPGGRGQR